MTAESGACACECAPSRGRIEKVYEGRGAGCGELGQKVAVLAGKGGTRAGHAPRHFSRRLRRQNRQGNFFGGAAAHRPLPQRRAACDVFEMYVDADHAARRAHLAAKRIGGAKLAGLRALLGKLNALGIGARGGLQPQRQQALECLVGRRRRNVSR